MRYFCSFSNLSSFGQLQSSGYVKFLLISTDHLGFLGLDLLGQKWVRAGDGIVYLGEIVVCFGQWELRGFWECL